MPCPIAGVCSRQPDCADLHCPGHPQLHQEDGGHVFAGGVVFPIENDGPQDEPEAGRPVPTVDQVESWPSRVLALLILLVVIAALSPLAFI